MDWITGIQRAIDYVESHLTEEIDFEAVAKEAYSSPFHFQRLFSFLCGYTLGDYVRMRRLSLAAEDLSRGEAKIIDVALKYGYDTPESFSRAFTRFHGISPSEAKNGAGVKLFSPLFVKLILEGGTKMDYRIEKLDAFQIICKRKKVAKPESETATKDISEFWNECAREGVTARICSYFPENSRLGGLLGVCFSSETDENYFPYAIGVEYDGRAIADKDLEVVTVPAHTYAVFTSRGKMPEAFQETYHKIVTEFFPQSVKYEYDCGVELEVYPSDNTDDPDYTCEIWVAIKDRTL